MCERRSSGFDAGGAATVVAGGGGIKRGRCDKGEVAWRRREGGVDGFGVPMEEVGVEGELEGEGSKQDRRCPAFMKEWSKFNSEMAREEGPRAFPPERLVWSSISEMSSSISELPTIDVV